MDDRTLPPLPPSDIESISKNVYDPLNKVRAGDFWKDAEIVPLNNKPMEKCNHEFKYTNDGVICTKCNFGLMGHDLEIRSGKLFAKGEPIGL